MFHDGQTIFPGSNEPRKCVLLAIGAAAAELAPPVDEIAPTRAVRLSDIEKCIRENGDLFCLTVGGFRTLVHVRIVDPELDRLELNVDLLEIDPDTLLDRAQQILLEGIAA